MHCWLFFVRGSVEKAASGVPIHFFLFSTSVHTCGLSFDPACMLSRAHISESEGERGGDMMAFPVRLPFGVRTGRGRSLQCFQGFIYIRPAQVISQLLEQL